MRPYSYGRQKFWEAVGALVGSGAMRKRLGLAYTPLLHLEPEVEKQLPPELVDRYRKLMIDLKARAVGGEYGPIEINSISPKADRMAEEILSIYTELQGGLS